MLEDRVLLRLDPVFLPKVVSSFQRMQVVLLTFVPHPSNEGKRSFHGLDLRLYLLSYLRAVSSFRSQRPFCGGFGEKQGFTALRSSLTKWIRLDLDRR